MLGRSPPGQVEVIAGAAAKSPKVTATSSCGIAIIGIACRFPGAADHRAYWRNLCDGIESLTVLTDGELAAAFLPSQLLQDPSYVKAASILPDIDQFDAAFFEYSPAEARLM